LSHSAVVMRSVKGCAKDAWVSPPYCSACNETGRTHGTWQALTLLHVVMCLFCHVP
jgi:hypothetical protein